MVSAPEEFTIWEILIDYIIPWYIITYSRLKRNVGLTLPALVKQAKGIAFTDID